MLVIIGHEHHRAKTMASYDVGLFPALAGDQDKASAGAGVR